MRGRTEGIALGLRWFFRARGNGRALAVRRIVGAAVATSVALLAVTLWQANDDRAFRGRQQEARSSLGRPAAFHVSKADAPYGGDVWTTIFVSGARDDAPAPPGVPHLPRAGETWVSPAVEEAMSSDHRARQRVPGRVAGVIRSEGLQSPDQLFVYAGVDSAANPNAWKAGGWGSPADTSGRPAVPRGAFLAILAALLGLPVLMLLRLTARMSAESRRRALAALHMLGVPTRTLATAAGTEALLCAVSGALLGCLLAGSTVVAFSKTTVLGMAWFAPPTVLAPASTLLVIALMCVAVAVDTTASTRRDLASVLQARVGGPEQRSRLWLSPLVLGLAALAGIVVPHAVLGTKLSSGVTYYYFLGGTFLAALGGLVSLGLLLRGLADAIRRRSSSLFAVLGARRLWWDSDPIGRSVAAILIVMVAGMIGAGALADLARLSPERSVGDQYTIALSGASTDQARAAVAVSAPLLAVRTTQGHDATWVGTCRSLAGIISTTDPAAGRTFSKDCRADTHYELVASGSARDGTLVIPGIDQTELDGAGILTSAPTSYGKSLRRAEVIAYPGRDGRDVDDYVSEVLGAAPTASVTNTSADIYKPMIPATRRLFLISCFLGFLIAVSLLGLTAADSYQRNRVHAARLIVIGASRSLSAKVHTTAVGLAAGLVIAVAAVIGWLSAVAYDIAGGTGATPGALGWIVTLFGVSLAAATVATSWITSRKSSGTEITELLHRE